MCYNFLRSGDRALLHLPDLLQDDLLGHSARTFARDDSASSFAFPFRSGNVFRKEDFDGIVVKVDPIVEPVNAEHRHHFRPQEGRKERKRKRAVVVVSHRGPFGNIG